MSEAPDLSSMTPDERDAYDAAMAQKHAAKLEREMRESWRLDQMRGRKEPLWMRYENEVSSDEETTVAVDELSKAIDVRARACCAREAHAIHARHRAAVLWWPSWWWLWW